MLNKSCLILFLIILPLRFALAANEDVLAYIQYDGDYWQAYVKQADGQHKKLTASAYDKSIVSWLADGQHLFVCGIQGQAEIINIKTNKSKKIKLPKTEINDAVISPDGKKIIYSYIPKNSPNNKLWLYDIDSARDQPLLVKQPGRQYDPKWNVKGDRYYFTTGESHQVYGINTSVIGSSGSNPVIQNAVLNFDVDASASGKIAWSSNFKQSFDIWIKQGKKATQLTKGKGSETHPSWSSDETAIYFVQVIDGINNIWRIAADGKGKAKQVTSSKTGARYPAVYKGDQ
jgi:Tol biopolymer transport system component